MVHITLMPIKYLFDISCVLGSPDKKGGSLMRSCVLGSPDKKGGSPMEKKWGAFPPFPSTSVLAVGIQEN
jgi:hypothetical protein